MGAQAKIPLVARLLRTKPAGLQPLHPGDLPCPVGHFGPNLQRSGRESALDRVRVGERPLERSGDLTTAGGITKWIEGSGDFLAFLPDEIDLQYRAIYGGVGKERRVGAVREHHDIPGRRRDTGVQGEGNRAASAGFRIGVVASPFSNQRVEIEIARGQRDLRGPRWCAANGCGDDRAGNDNGSKAPHGHLNI
jgi:hypothetical protein